MPTYDPRIDEYISKSAEFAQPILTQIRDIIHRSCPEINETIKWGFPHFEYAGGILCSMAAFKQHCAFSFWLGSLMADPDHLLSTGGDKTSMGHFGQMKTMDDVPADRLLSKYIKEAMSLNLRGVKASKKPKPAEPKRLEMPEYLAAILKKNKQASEVFSNFSPSHKNEYLEWITEAKTEATRTKRIDTMLEWLAEGKPRHWKYNVEKTRKQ